MIDQAHAGTDSVIHYGIAPDGGVTGPDRAEALAKQAAETLGASSAASSVRPSVASPVGKRGAGTLSGDGSLDLNRLTDQAQPCLLNTGGVGSILTANKTLWMSAIASVPKVRADSATWLAFCLLSSNVLLGDTALPPPPYLASPVGLTSFYDPRK